MSTQFSEKSLAVLVQMKYLIEKMTLRSIFSGAAGACAGRPKVLGASAGEAGIETGDPPKKTATTTKVTPFLVTERPPQALDAKFHF